MNLKGHAALDAARLMAGLVFAEPQGVLVRPTLVINPRSDPAFAQLAESLVREGHTTPEGLQAALRSQYPSAIVRARGLEGERAIVFYVYRDGHWTSY